MDVKEHNVNHVMLEWTGNSVNDMVADSVLAVILNIESSPASVKLTKSDHTHSHTHGQPHSHASSSKDNGGDEGLALVDRHPSDEFQDLVMFFESQFGGENVTQNEKTRTIEITMDGVHATIDCVHFTVQCEADALRHRAQNVLERAVRTCME